MKKFFFLFILITALNSEIRAQIRFFKYLDTASYPIISNAHEINLFNKDAEEKLFIKLDTLNKNFIWISRDANLIFLVTAGTYKSVNDSTKVLRSKRLLKTSAIERIKTNSKYYSWHDLHERISIVFNP